MKKYFKLFSATLFSALLIMGCSVEKNEVLSENMRQQIALLPEGANAVAYVNFARMKQSYFFNLFMDSVAGHPFRDNEYLDFVKQTGLDIEKDIHEIYMVSGFDQQDPVKNALILVTGAFEPEKLVAYLRKKADEDKIDEESFEGHTIYTAEEATKSFCFYTPSTFVAGSPDMVKGWITRSDKNETSNNGTLLARINELRFKNSAWFTMKADQFVKNLNMDKMNKMKGLEELNAMSVSMNFDETFQLNGQSEFSTDETAELFKDAIKGFIATGKLSVSDDREVIDILNSIQVDSDGNRVTIDLKLSQEEVRKLMNQRNFLPVNII